MDLLTKLRETVTTKHIRGKHEKRKEKISRDLQ